MIANVPANPVPDSGIAKGKLLIVGIGMSLRNINSEESPPYLYNLIFVISSLSNLKNSGDKFICIQSSALSNGSIPAVGRGDGTLSLFHLSIKEAL